jgi:hypothetical protein
VRFGILRVHRILRRPRIRVTRIDPTGRLGLIRYSLRDTARTRSVLANPDPRFARTQRTSWGQFPPAAWVGFIAQATADASGSSIHCAFRGTGRYPPNPGATLVSRSWSSLKGLHPMNVFLFCRKDATTPMAITPQGTHWLDLLLAGPVASLTSMGAQSTIWSAHTPSRT